MQLRPGEIRTFFCFAIGGAKVEASTLATRGPGKLPLISLLPLLLILAGCPALQNTARDTIAAAKGVLLSAQVEYGQECQANPAETKCVDIHNAVEAQNTAIDALTIYCSGATKPSFLDGGPCTPDKSKAPKLQAALQTLDAIIRDVKGFVK